jgi:hypothetical protein
MSDPLTEALAAEGLGPAQIQRVHDRLRRADVRVSIDYEARSRRERLAERDRLAAAATGMPEYHGSIARCQVGIARSIGRMTDFDRCSKRPVRVRRIPNDLAGSDGRIAVCALHAKIGYVARWRGETNPYRNPSRPADEAVEPEYQP